MKVFAVMFRLIVASTLIVIAGAGAAQQSYPNKPIRFIVPFEPGGSNEALARIFGPKLTESWGQQVIVDFRAGGNTVIGTEALVKSPPDGYSLLLMNMAHVITPLLIPTPYDALKDFAAVATISKSECLLVLHPSVPANTLQEFIALAKSRPGQLNYATSGRGGSTHLATELLSMMTGIRMQHIPYKGAGPAMIDLLGGQVQLAINVPINYIQHVNSGKLKAVAITGDNRLSSLPQLPTFAEAGLPGFDVKIWFGFLAPAATPREIVDRLSTEIARILTLPDIKASLASQGMDPLIYTPTQFAALMRTDLARFANVVKTANIKMSN